MNNTSLLSNAFINTLLNHKQLLLSCSSLKIKTDRHYPEKETEPLENLTVEWNVLIPGLEQFDFLS